MKRGPNSLSVSSTHSYWHYIKIELIYIIDSVWRSPCPSLPSYKLHSVQLYIQSLRLNPSINLSLDKKRWNKLRQTKWSLPSLILLHYNPIVMPMGCRLRRWRRTALIQRRGSSLISHYPRRYKSEIKTQADMSCNTLRPPHPFRKCDPVWPLCLRFTRGATKGHSLFNDTRSWQSSVMYLIKIECNHPTWIYLFMEYRNYTA